MPNHEKSEPRYSSKMPDETYNKKLQISSRHSANYVNLAYPYKKVEAIDWDDPEYAVTDDDTRWIMPNNFDLGASNWYQNLPTEEQIRIGKYRYAQVAKTGSEFEEALIAGIMLRNMRLPSDHGEVEYSTHEAHEEVQHIQMFKNMVNRIDSKPHGAPNWFRNFSLYVGHVARHAPVAFWAIVLAGEEPIDYTQRDLVKMGREGLNIHPMLEKVMDWHIKEEAHHINFADRYQKQRIEKLTPLQKQLFAATLPLILRVAANAILKPSKQDQKAMGIPDEVMKEVWWNSESGQKNLNGMFANTARRADVLGLRNGDEKLGAPKNRLGQLAWRLAGLNPTK